VEWRVQFPASLFLLPAFIVLGVAYVTAGRWHDPRLRSGLRLAILTAMCGSPVLTRGPGPAQLILGLVAGYLAIRMVALGRRSRPAYRRPQDSVARAALALMVPEDLFVPTAMPRRHPLSTIALGMAGVAVCILLLVWGNDWRLWQKSLAWRILDDQLVMVEVAVGTAGLHHLIVGIARWCGHSVAGLQTQPLLSASLAEFWAQRWNHMVEGNLRRAFFQPCVRSRPGRGGLGLLATFTASGVLHVMAVAGAGPLRSIAWPSASIMAFFLLHAGLILLERRLGWHRAAHQPGLRLLARLRTILVIAAFSPLLLDPFARVTHVHGRSLSTPQALSAGQFRAESPRT
jgi:hypothetical protein